MRVWIFCAALTAGCAPGVPVGLLPRAPHQTSLEGVDANRAVFAALLASIEIDANVVVAGNDLDTTAYAGLRGARPDVVKQHELPSRSSLPARAILIEGVTISGDSAVVQLTAGPVPPAITWVCGRAMTVYLHRHLVWEVKEEGLRFRCTGPGPPGLSVQQANLLEAARLAFSRMRLDPAVRIVSGSALSSEALATLSAIDKVSRRPLETDAMILPEGVFELRKLELLADAVDFRGTLGPVPRHATLACGTDWIIAMRLHADGWEFKKIELIMC